MPLGSGRRGRRGPPQSPPDLAALPRPMLTTVATLASAPLRDPRLVYERKYDGIRAIVEAVPVGEAGDGVAGVDAGSGRARVRIASRARNDKTSQVSQIAAAVAGLVQATRNRPVL